MTDDVSKPGSPHIVTAILTLVVACFAFVTFGRAYQDRWEYPYLSLEDPARTIFLWAESERRIAMLWPASAPIAPPSIEHAAAAWTGLAYEAIRAGVDPSDDKAGIDVAKAGARVIAAGWGNPEQIAVVRDMDEANVPEYLAERIRQIKRGETQVDRIRARTAFGWNAILLALQYSAMLVALVGSLFLWRRRRVSAGEGEARSAVVFGLPQAWVILSWSFAALALVWRLVYLDVPVLGDIGRAFSSLLLALVAFILVRDTHSSDSSTPLRRMLSVPREKSWVVLAVAAYGLSMWFEHLVYWGLGPLGVSFPWSESFVEPLIHGSGALAVATVLELVVFAPLGEEVLFRGVLFGALLSKLTTHRAALLSGVLFGLWHGYGLAGTLAVAFDGYLWARLYARTGSLIPGMVAHGVINAAVCLTNLSCRA